MLSHLMDFLLPYLVSPLSIGAFALGATIGSFLNVCIYRIPSETFFKHSRSVCRSCGAKIPAYLNVPIVSWLILRGKTACCKSGLSVQYPLVETFTAIIFVVLYWSFPFVIVSGGGYEVDPGNLLRFLHGVIFASLLIICSVIDIHLMIIPDVLSLPMIALTPVIIFFHPDLSWFSGLIGVLAGGGSLYAIAWIYWLIRKEVGMGMGDVKLLAGIGGWLGYQSIIPTIFYGSILGASIGILAMVISRKLTLQSAIPFGPFLAIGAMIHLLLGPEIQEYLFYQGEG
jgi:leader peptidase (prepilin peptidase) / N-methyltransferase